MMLAKKLDFGATMITSANEPFNKFLSIRKEHENILYELTIEIKSIPAIPSAKCCNCGNTTKELFDHRMMRLATDEEKAYEHITKTILNEAASGELIGSSHVNLITDIHISGAWRINSYDMGGPKVSAKITRILNEKVLGSFLCNGCLTPDYLMEKTRQI